MMKQKNSFLAAYQVKKDEIEKAEKDDQTELFRRIKFEDKDGLLEYNIGFGKSLEVEIMQKPALKKITRKEWLLHILLAWLCAVSVYFIANKGKVQTTDLVGRISIPEFIISWVFFGVVIILLQNFALFYRAETYVAAGLMLCYSWSCVNGNRNFEFYFGMLVLTLVVLLCVCRCSMLQIKSGQNELVIFIAMAAGYLAVVGGTLVFRYLTYSSPAYDFGIWTQMFYYMKTAFLPLTTVERSELLSHFAIHFSPIYYLYLPVYAIFPYAVTLQVLQAVTVISGIVPLWLICRRWGFDRKARVVWGLIYTLYPALAKSCYFDLHENCFLVPLLLWLFWTLETERGWAMVLFTVLTLAVKEDAAVYVACIGLFVLLEKKNFKKGLVLTIAAVVWFLTVQYFMKKYGLGVMSGRYDNFMSNDGSLVDVVKNFVMNPAYAVSQCFSAEKIKLILILMLPVGFLPVMTKKIARYVLFLPIILINFASNYGYQATIDYQYTFGTSAILIYLAVLNYREVSGRRKYTACTCALCAGLLSTPVYALSGDWIVTAYFDRIEEFTRLDEMLASIPEDASVSASSPFVAHIANHKVLYEYPGSYSHEDAADYLIIDLRSAVLSDADLEYIAENGYVQERYLEGMYVVYKLPE